MGSYQIVNEEITKKRLKKLHSIYHKKIIDALDEIKKYPNHRKNLKLTKMAGYHDQYRIKIHPIRIVFKFDHPNLSIYIIEISQREGAYKKRK